MRESRPSSGRGRWWRTAESEAVRRGKRRRTDCAQSRQSRGETRRRRRSTSRTTADRSAPSSAGTSTGQWHMAHTHTHTHPFNGPFQGLPGWAGTREVKPIWILLKQETVSGSGISWAICKSASRSRQISMPVPHHSSFFTGRMPFLPANQQRQSTEGTHTPVYTHPFNGPLSGTTRVGRYQKGKTKLDFTEARDSE